MLWRVFFLTFLKNLLPAYYSEGTRYPGFKFKGIPVPSPDPGLQYPEPARNRKFTTRCNTSTGYLKFAGISFFEVLNLAQPLLHCKQHYVSMLSKSPTIFRFSFL